MTAVPAVELKVDDDEDTGVIIRVDLPRHKLLMVSILRRLCESKMSRTRVWDIPCTAHPALHQLEAEYRDYLRQSSAPPPPPEIISAPILARSQERRYFRIARDPLADDMRRNLLSLELSFPTQYGARIIGNDYGPWRYRFGKYSRAGGAEGKGAIAAGVQRALGKRVRVSGQFFYPEGGFREWHTNAFSGSGWRVYLVLVDEPKRSAMNVWSAGKCVICWDTFPAFVRLFRVNGIRDRALGRRLAWHSVWSDTRRFSLGLAPAWADIRSFLPLAKELGRVWG